MERGVESGPVEEASAMSASVCAVIDRCGYGCHDMEIGSGVWECLALDEPFQQRLGTCRRRSSNSLPDQMSHARMPFAAACCLILSRMVAERSSARRA